MFICKSFWHVAAKRRYWRGEGAAEFLPPPPSFRRTRADWFKNFAQNGFALHLEYPTIQNFSTFSLGTSRNARRAERRGSPGIEPHNPTAQKTKRKRICISKILI